MIAFLLPACRAGTGTRMPSSPPTTTITSGLGRAERRGATAGYYLGFLILGLVLAVLGPTLPGPAAQTGSELSEVSFVFVARSLGGLAGAILACRLYDHRPGHPLLALTLGTMALASIFPTALSFAERRMRIRGWVTSWFFVGASMGATTLPWLMGQLFSSTGPQAVMVGILVDLSAGLVVLGALLRYRSASPSG